MAAGVIDAESKIIQRRILELQVEHRDLDEVIARMASSSNVDQLQLTRLKKRKLLIKDTLARLKSALIPDLDA